MANEVSFVLVLSILGVLSAFITVGLNYSVSFIWNLFHK